jgi:hypothetical protein
VDEPSDRRVLSAKRILGLLQGYFPPAVRRAARAVSAVNRGIPADALSAVRALEARGCSRTEVFSAIYAGNVWGGEPGEFYSGGGSESVLSDPYSELINDFLAHLDLDLRSVTVVDLGCGDFRVGGRLNAPGIRYLGIDVVPELVDRNTRLFETESVGFVCLDIVEDALPAGEVCLVRQVLQHLSNSDIASVLPRLEQYDHVFVTEHLPSDERDVLPNRDKPTGHATRLNLNSGVYLDKPPFGLTDVRTVLVQSVEDGGKLVTTYLDRHTTPSGSGGRSSGI